MEDVREQKTPIPVLSFTVSHVSTCIDDCSWHWV